MIAGFYRWFRYSKSCAKKASKIFKDLDPLLDSQLKLAIIFILLSITEADFVFIFRKEKTDANASNLSVKIEKLKETNYIDVQKFIDSKKV